MINDFMRLDYEDNFKKTKSKKFIVQNYQVKGRTQDLIFIYDYC